MYEQHILKGIDYIKSGEKPKHTFKIGVEFEHFVINKENGNSIQYVMMEKIFRELMSISKFKPVYENKKIISLFNNDYSLTIEPGCQLEISIVPQKNISDIEKIYKNFSNLIKPLLKKINHKMFSMGFHPFQISEDIKLVPKKRYKHMFDHFKETGIFGKNMMKSTNTIHINIDYTDEKDFNKKFLLIQKLAPISNLLFNNSPFSKNKISEEKFLRIKSWLNTDDKRCGFVKAAFSSDFGYKKYVDYVFKTPMIVELKNNKYIYQGHKNYYDFLKNNNLTDENLKNQFSMLFPIIRAKNYIEIRLSDGLPNKYRYAPIVFWKNLLYFEDNLNILKNFFKDVTFEDTKILYYKVLNSGFNNLYFKNKPIIETLNFIFELIDSKLKKNEAKYFSEYKNLIINENKIFTNILLDEFNAKKTTVLNYINKYYE